jgi:hypothetical protein
MLPKPTSTFELRKSTSTNKERLIERLADEGQNTDDVFGRSLRLFERYRVFLDRVSSLQRKSDESPSACRAERSKPVSSTSVISAESSAQSALR